MKGPYQGLIEVNRGEHISNIVTRNEPMKQINPGTSAGGHPVRMSTSIILNPDLKHSAFG